ncbi:hypothetical protein CYY_001933 [Polysphondylium violaceum]|uniref:Heat shock protein Hsp70 family protein n=1 Tax=Polysphondylium violaceum TaxID=133409 RepID=A0A8J4Q0W6_9MYCE|nr:hypothetical protein CYY_001933 [Polysphondylium violaceum]
MFVVGFDFGNKNCTIAVAQKGGVDVISNEVSNRLTPTLVSFGEKERYLGEPALTNHLRNIRNTITNIKRYIGKEFNDEQVQKELKSEMYSFKELPNGTVGYDVNYLNEQHSFTSESVLGMLFGKLKRTTEAFVNTPVRDVVISVPVMWNDFQRRAVLDAGVIAGLNIVRLVNDTTATALSYGIYKEFSETEPTNVLFVDVGDASTSVSAVQFKKGQLKTLATSSDENVGSRLFEDSLVKHFAKEFQTKYKINVFENKKALIRLYVACEKVKKILSSNNEAPISIDSLMEDIDVKSMIDRATFEQLIENDLMLILEPIKKVLAATNMTPDQFQSIEITGGGTRSTSLQKKMIELLGRDLSKTINCEESVCRGCALQCAMLSPVFRVRPFLINDTASHPISVSFKSASSSQNLEVFNVNSPIPSPKPLRISFPISKAEPFQITATSSFGVVSQITVDQVAAFTNKSSIKAKVYLDIHGIFHMEEVKLVEQIPEEEPKEAAPAETPAPKEGETAPVTSPKPADKVKVKETALQYTFSQKGMTREELKLAVEEELRMQSSDNLAVETAEKKNSLESYIYDMRNKLGSSLKEYVTAAESQQFMELLNKTMDWLDYEGEDQTKSVYTGKLDPLVAIGAPIEKRKRDREDYPHYVQELKNTANFYINEANSTDAKYEHISREEKEKIIQDANAAIEWVNSIVAKEQSVPKTEACSVKISDVISRKNALETSSKSILSKPKPKPVPVTPPPAPAAETKPEEPKQDMETEEQPKEEKPKEDMEVDA